MSVPTPEDGLSMPATVRDLPPNQRNVLAAPLIDPHERARVGIPTGENETIAVVIELSLTHPGGAGGAYQSLSELWRTVLSEPAPERSEEYLRVLLSMNQIKTLVREDGERPGRRRAIYRVWPDFPVDVLDASQTPTDAS